MPLRIKLCVEQNEYNHFLEDSFSKLKLINNQMAIMQAQKSKQSKPYEKNDSLLEQFKSISYAYSNSQQKIVELEESLRIETINSEEQRAYIEVLKAALESKINDLGLMNFIKETAKYSKTNHLDLFIHFQKLKENIDSQSNETKSQETRILELDEMTQKLEKTQRALEDSMGRLKEKDDFINNLQREIASLHKHIQVLEGNQNQGGNNRSGYQGKNTPDMSSELMKELEMLKKKYQELINRAPIEKDNNGEEIGHLRNQVEKLMKENNGLRNELEKEKRRNKDGNGLFIFFFI